MPNGSLTLDVQLVGDSEVAVKGGMSNHAGQHVALGVPRGLPQVAHLCAGGAVDFIEELDFRLAKEVGLPGHLSRRPGSLGDAGGHHRFVAAVDQGAGARRHVDLGLDCRGENERERFKQKAPESRAQTSVPRTLTVVVA